MWLESLDLMNSSGCYAIKGASKQLGFSAMDGINCDEHYLINMNYAEWSKC